MRNSRFGDTSDPYGLNSPDPSQLDSYYDTASSTVENIWNDAIGVWNTGASNLEQGLNYAIQNPFSAASALLPGLPEVAGTSEAAQTELGQPLRNAVGSSLETILLWGGIVILGLIVIDKEIL